MSSEKKVSVVRQVASQKDLDALVEALKMTVSEGTASSLHKEDFCSYGKTGTAQVFDKNIGPNTILGLNRGLNALWTEGGILYSPPFRFPFKSEKEKKSPVE